MGFWTARRLVAFGGAGIALAAGLAIAWDIMAHSHPPATPPPASQGGLVVVSGRDDDAKLDPKRPLRCFVAGQFVGELPLADCARRNGVATGALDVGLDQAGALAATNGLTSEITPLPPQQPPQAPQGGQPAPQPTAPSVGAAPPEQAAPGFGAACWRYGAGGWRKLPAPLSLTACVQALYAGRCPADDEAFYGRWGDQTLRLVGGRVEISADNRTFKGFVDPWPPCEAAPG